MNEKEIVEKLKRNTQCLLGLSEEEKAVLRKYIKHVGFIGNSGKLIRIGGCTIECNGNTYRIEESFQLPEMKPQSDWFIADVGDDGYFTDQDGNMRRVFHRTKGFAGVQFHGQYDNWWYFFKEAAISSTGQIMPLVSEENKSRPARISRVRIWIGGE